MPNLLRRLIIAQIALLSGITAIDLTTPSAFALQETAVNTKYIIVPGKSLGGITKTTTYRDLVRLFGAKRLTPTTYYGPEGLVSFPSTKIKLDGDRYVQVVWKNKQRDRTLAVITNDPRYQTKEGVRVGMTFPQLRRIAGKFKVMGLYWDYGNKVIYPQRKNYPFPGLSISVDVDKQAGEKYPDDISAVSGDVELFDDDPRWKRLKMSVSFLENWME